MKAFALIDISQKMPNMTWKLFFSQKVTSCESPLFLCLFKDHYNHYRTYLLLSFMPANQPHSVYGSEPTIIHGGHFFLASVMETTAQSLFHSFVMNQFLTNTFHYRSRQLLRRILDFFRLGLLERKLALSGMMLYPAVSS